MTVAMGAPDAEMGHTPPNRPSLFHISFALRSLYSYVNMDVPDHEFIVPTAVDVVRIRRREDIVRHIATNVGSIVRPLHLSWHTGDLCNGLTFGKDFTGICIALHIVLAALPLPIGAPLDTRAR